MLTEMNGKSGTVCGHAKAGKIRCPLIIRPNSEDVITGELFSRLQAIQSRWWLSDILGSAVDPHHANQTLHRKMKILLWQRQPRFPSVHLPWREGSTEVDVVITWENPATTLYIEMKYGAPISKSTSNHNDECGYPNDQIIRNIRVGLWRTGNLTDVKLFEIQRRKFIFLLCCPGPREKLIDQYRDAPTLEKCIPKLGMQLSLPEIPFVGQVSFNQIAAQLQNNRQYMSPPERILTDQIAEYLELKTNSITQNSAKRSDERELSLHDAPLRAEENR